MEFQLSTDDPSSQAFFVVIVFYPRAADVVAWWSSAVKGVWFVPRGSWQADG